MIYKSAEERAKEIDEIYGKRTHPYRMAHVESIDNGQPILRFHGETKASQKKYKRISSYSPQIGDNVLLARTSGTYVIIGKVV